MKKLIAIMICLAMTLGCAALAETAEKETLGKLSVNGAFEIKCRMPEGYRLSILSSDSTNVVAVAAAETEGKPQLSLSIAFNDLFTAEDGTAYRMNDITEEGIEEIKASFLDQIGDATFEDAETALGTRLLIVRGHVDEDTQAVVFYSVYQSYEIELVATMGQNAGDLDLTEEQIRMIIDFLTDMDFVPIG